MAEEPVDVLNFKFSLFDRRTIELHEYREAISEHLRRHQVNTLPSGTAQDIVLEILPEWRLQAIIKVDHAVGPEERGDLWSLVGEAVHRVERPITPE